MTGNITKICFWGPDLGPEAKNVITIWKIWIKCENDVKLWNHIIFTSFSYYFHIMFFYILGPRTRAQARVPGPKMWKEYDNNIKNMKIMWFLSFTLFSHFIYIFTFLSSFFGLGTQIQAPKIIFFHIPGHIFLYYFHIVWKPSFPACPHGQFLQGSN